MSPRALESNDLGEAETWAKETRSEGRRKSLGQKSQEGAGRMTGEMMVEFSEIHLGFRMDHEPTISQNIG